MRLLLIMLALATNAVNGSEYFVATNGSSANPGTISSPLSFAKAVATNSPATSGDTIWVRDGIYLGPFTSYLSATSNAPIVVRRYLHERPIISTTNQSSAPLTIHGSNTWYWGLEISQGAGMAINRLASMANGIDTQGQGTRLINLVSHDNEEGYGFWEGASNAVMYGCVAYHNGWWSTNNGRHGHAVYTQNLNGTKLLKDCIWFDNFSFGMHAYGTAAHLNNFRVAGNVSFNNGMVTGGSAPGFFMGSEGEPIINALIETNFSYFSSADGAGFVFGYHEDGTNGDIAINASYLGRSQLQIVNPWNSIVITNCTFRVPVTPLHNRLVDTVPDIDTAAIVWNWNTYHAATTSAGFAINGVGFFTLSQWQSSKGRDLNSTLITNAPSQTDIFVRTNEYEAGRANIIVYNWGLSNVVNVDLSGLVPTRQHYVVQNVQDYFGAPVWSGVYDGGTIALPMTNLVSSPPMYWATNTEPTWPEFAVFVIEQSGQSQVRMTVTARPQ